MTSLRAHSCCANVIVVNARHEITMLAVQTRQFAGYDEA